MTEDWRSAAEWAEAAKALGVDRKIMPHSERNVSGKAARDSWPSRDRQKPGGGREYPLSAVPAAFQKALARAALTAPRAALPAPVQLDLALPRVEDMKSYQKGPFEARLALLAELDRMVLIDGFKISHAIDALCAAAGDGTLAPDLARLVPIANARSGKSGGRSISPRAIKYWRAELARSGGRAEALAPKAAPEAGIPAWAKTFMDLYCIPQKPGIAEVLDDQWPAGMEKPSYDQVQRFLKKVDAVTRNRGRLGRRALQALRAYKARDVSELWPGAVFIGDGHTHKAAVAHPIHGQPFRPEVTSTLDVFTRRWVGWSAALAENTWAVADSLRHALTTATSCDIFYYDNGSGAKNKTWDDDCTGMAARIGFTKLHSAPWSSQARGVIERFHSSVLHRVARRSASYLGPRMDKEARQAAYKITKAEIKASGQSRLLPSWADFIAEIDAEMERYNNRPHDSLPRIIDAATGKRRHMSPNEVWNKAVAEGWKPDPISTEEARTLFRPAVRRPVRRALVSWIGNEYFAPELEGLHGDEVVVSYDLHDAGSVEVSLPDGRWVCTARWNGHKTAYVPVTFAQHAHDQRVANRLARHDDKRGRIAAEGTPQLALVHQSAVEIPVELMRAAEAEAERLEARNRPTVEIGVAKPPAATVAKPPAATVEPGQRPSFGDDASWARWVLDNPGLALDADRAELRRKLRSNNFRSLLEMQGLDVGALTAFAA